MYTVTSHLHTQVQERGEEIDGEMYTVTSQLATYTHRYRRGGRR